MSYFAKFQLRVSSVLKENQQPRVNNKLNYLVTSASGTKRKDHPPFF